MGIWRRNAPWAFVAGWGTNLAASLVVWHYLLDRKIDPNAWWLYFVQANVIASASVALVWLGARRLRYAASDLSLTGSFFLTIQVWIGAVAHVLLLGVPVATFIATPGTVDRWVLALGQTQGWVALLLAAAAALWYVVQVSPRQLPQAVTLFGLAAGALLACRAVAWDSSYLSRGPGDWMAYHVLLVSWTVVAVCVFLAVCLVQRFSPSTVHNSTVPPVLDSPTQDLFAAARLAWQVPREAVTRWVLGLGTFLTMLAVRGFDDPRGPFWSAGVVMVVGLLCIALAVWERRRELLIAAGLLVNVIFSLIWWKLGDETLSGLLLANVAGFATASLWIRGIEWGLSKKLPVWKPQAITASNPAMPFPQLAALLALCGLGVLVLWSLGGSLLVDSASLNRVQLSATFSWITLALTALALVACWGDAQAGFSRRGAYVLGWMALGLWMHTQHLAAPDMAWWGCWLLAGYGLLVALLVRLISRVPARSAWLIGNEDEAQSNAGWLSSCQAFTVGLSSLLAVWVSLGGLNSSGSAWQHFWPGSARLVGPLAALLGLAVALLHGLSGKAGRSVWQRSVFPLTLFALADCGWAAWPWVSPVDLAPWLHASVVLMVAAAVMFMAGRTFLVRLLPAGEWSESNARSAPALFGLVVVMLLAVLGQEIFLFDSAASSHPMAKLAVVLVGLALIGLGVVSICCAVLPNRDPWKLSERGRQVYVYGAEVLLVLLGLHIRLTVPELFGHGFFQRYGLFIVMAIAFAGAGLAEWFQRRGVSVLAEPLSRTASILPLMLALAAWKLGRLNASLWFMMSLFYGYLSVARRSFSMALAASACVNLGLWMIWDQRGWNFTDHLQLWLIPLALSALIAEQLNHRRLSKSASSSIRYLGLSVIYVSSTADMFLSGFSREHWYLPIILMFLSVFGVLCGIMLRVRSFLFLGVAFLVLSLITLISHAAWGLGYMWIAWLSGIMLGFALIALFAVFEKKKNDILEALERFKQWE